MRGIVVSLILLFGLSGGPAVHAESESFECAGEAGVDYRNAGETKSEYARRSVAILESAVGDAEDTLGRLVLPNARFEIWDGDRATLYHVSGPAAAVEFARDLDATEFEYVVPRTFVSMDACDLHNVEVRVTQGVGPDGFLVQFNFSHGRLATAIAHRASVVRGTFAQGEMMGRSVENDE